MQRTMTQTETAASHPSRTIKEYVGLVLRGACMGASDIVPGVSGGTMAFILGIYEELINSIRAVGQPAFLRAVAGFHLKEISQLLNWQFLLPVATGILLAILTLSRGLEWMLVNQPVYLWSFFFGLVMASVIVVSKRIGQWRVALGGVLVAAATGAYALVGLVPVQTPNSWWFLFLSGALAICAMILPGISGAFILVLLGKYEYVLSAVNNRDVVTIGIVGIGAMVGIVTFAQILGWLFKRYHDSTVAALTGLMLGSLRKVWPWKVDIAWLSDGAGQFVLDGHGERIVTRQANVLPGLTGSGAVAEAAIAIGLMALGVGAILLLDRLANQQTG